MNDIFDLVLATDDLSEADAKAELAAAGFDVDATEKRLQAMFARYTSIAKNRAYQDEN